MARFIENTDTPKTPYQKVMESPEVSEEKKEELRQIYISLNPAKLKRVIDRKLDWLYKAYRNKTKPQRVESQKKLKPNSLTFYTAQLKTASLT